MKNSIDWVAVLIVVTGILLIGSMYFQELLK